MDAPYLDSRLSVIEIVGPPGSGKSTLARELAARLRESSSAVWLSKELQTARKGTQAQLTAGARSLVDVVRLWPFFYRSYSGETLLSQVRWTTLLRRVLRHGYARRLADERRLPQGLLILEPGWQMQLLNGYLFSRKPLSVSEATQFLKAIPPSDWTICLLVQADIAIARLERRCRGLPQRMQQLHESQWQEVIERGNRTTHILASQGKVLGRAVLEFDVSRMTSEGVRRKVQNFLLADTGESDRFD